MLITLLSNGIIIGSIYALVTLGFVLAFRSIDAFNFFHGELYMLGAFLGFAFNSLLKFPMILSLLLAILITGLVGIMVERIAIRPLLSAPRFQIIFATATLGLIIRHSVLLYTKAEAKLFPQYLPATPLKILNVQFKPQQLLIIAMTIILIISLYAFFGKTKLGKAMRASASNIRAAVLMGVNVDLTQMLTFGIASVLGAAAGILAAPLFIVDANMGQFMITKIFCVAVLGGLNSTTGAIIAGYLLGITENLVGGYISTDYQDAIAFIIILLVLIVRPTGIMGKKVLVKV